MGLGYRELQGIMEGLGLLGGLLYKVYRDTTRVVENQCKRKPDRKWKGQYALRSSGDLSHKIFL